MANIRKKKTSSFTSFSNALTQNNDLSFACRGMLVYVLSKPVDWECRPDDIERAGDIGKEARRKIMIEAEKAGYLTFNRIRNKTGQIVCWYDAHEEPVPEIERTKSWETPNGKQQPPAEKPEAVNDQPPPGLPPAGKPVDGSTASGKPADIIKTEVQSTEDKKQREKSPLSLPAQLADTEDSLFKAIQDVTGFSPASVRDEQALWTEAEKLRGADVTPALVRVYASTRDGNPPKLRFLYEDLIQWRNTSPVKVATICAPPPPAPDGLSPSERKQWVLDYYKNQPKAA